MLRGEFLCGRMNVWRWGNDFVAEYARRAEGMSEGSILVKVSVRNVAVEELGKIERKK